MKPEDTYNRPTCCCCNKPADIKEENVNWCANHYQTYGNKKPYIDKYMMIIEEEKENDRNPRNTQTTNPNMPKMRKHMAKQNTTPEMLPQMPHPILEQTTQKEEKKMTTEETETQGRTINPMDNQKENKQKLLRVMTGILNQAIRRPLLIRRAPLSALFSLSEEFIAFHSKQ